MNQSLATLFLCCSAIASIPNAFAEDSSTKRAPWADLSTASQPIAPLKTAPASLSDLGFATTRGEELPWMRDVKQKLTESSPVSEQDQAPAMDYEMQVFISAGMPDGVLRHLFQQAMNYPAGKIRFVLRGFVPQKLGPLIAKMRGLFPDPHTEHIALEVDPNAFRAYAVEAVPIYLVREEGKWYEVQGTQSLEAAKLNVKRRAQHVMGELYDIAEPDILAVMQERAKNFNWKPVMERAQQRMAENLKPGFDLPTASRDSTAYVVPTFTVPQDVKSPGKQGEAEVTLAKAGQTFNLLDHTRLQVPLIVFDPSDKRQVSMVQRWIQEPSMKNADLFIVGSKLTSNDAMMPVVLEVAKAFNRPTYPWMSKLSDRMGVEAVPAIVEQEGQRLRVRYFDPEKR